MDQQVSPAVVVIVLILIVAILVGLYFLVIEREPKGVPGEQSIVTPDVAAPGGAPEPPGEPVAPENAGATDDGQPADQEAADAAPTSDETPADAGPAAPAPAEAAPEAAPPAGGGQ